jgi:CheY-like chemotaxis protein/nitrogen-specific signal transduction histidine kinase
MKSINILIVDDNSKNLLSLRTLIEEYLNLHVFEANSGVAALKMTMKHSVDLILLDVQMPEMDGFETAKVIHSRVKTRHVPIVFLTAAYKSKEFQQKGYELGAVDYLIKPIDPHQFINRIQTYVRFIEQEHQIQERSVKILNTNKLLQQEIVERQQIEKALKQEIVERQQIEKALKEAKEIAEHAQQEAEAANVAKSQFLANMSHELRTPLNAILGYSEILREDAEDLGQQDFIPDLQKIDAAGKHLLGLINDVLDLSKIESGKMDLFIESVDLDKLIDEVLSTAQPLIEKNANLFKIERPTVLGKIQTDMTKLRQMLLNLLSNAAKFTEQGVIEFQIARQINAEGEWMIFCVTDDGIGMTEKQQEKLFHPFTQADASTTRRYGGTGLGLTITKDFAEMMGGHIKFASDLGFGSTFTLSLPMQAKAIPINKASKLEYSKTVSELESSTLTAEGIILLIDDDPMVREALKHDLSQFGYAVACATDGIDGIKLANKLRPDAILLDAEMPEMDGWRILSMLKSDSLLALIPVIMISMEEIEHLGEALDIYESITKPINSEQLVAILKKYRLQNELNSLIMVVEDNASIRHLTMKIIENEGWQVFPAENGQIALDHLSQKKPDLILLDLNMPVMDGFELITHLQANEKWRKIPVIVLTAIELNAEEFARLNHCVDSIYRKGTYNQEELILRIHQIISESSVQHEKCSRK